MLKQIALVSLLLVAVAACEGRDPLITQKNDDAIIEPPPPPPPPPVPELRTLGTKKLFGALPVENRFQDPLLTFTGTGWFAYSNNFNEYPVVVRQVGPSPTQTPFVRIAGADNPDGAVLLGQLKVATTALHVEIWLGRDGDGASFDTVDVSLAGLFVGAGEAAIGLEPDEASRTIVDGRTWLKVTADLEEGPVGWAYLMAGDTDTATTLYIGGPAAVDLEAGAGAVIVSSAKRSLTASEKALMQAVQERTRTLGAPSPSKLRPAPMPGVPTAMPSR